MNEIMHEPGAKSVPAFRNEDNDCRQMYEASMGWGGGEALQIATLFVQ